jgi:hypothetical protein
MSPIVSQSEFIDVSTRDGVYHIPRGNIAAYKGENYDLGSPGKPKIKAHVVVWLYQPVSDAAGHQVRELVADQAIDEFRGLLGC